MGTRPARIVLLSGGSACRSINIALCRREVALTRIVPAWDSGGSSKAIREAFGILSVGDIRQALMTMAHGQGRAGDVVKICNARLSTGADPAEAAAEFLYYAEGRHPLLERLEPGLRGTILNYLRTFRDRLDGGFDFRNGSIGNFILTGACLAHNGDINTAIFVFRKLCGIDGHVWPASTQDGTALSAILNDGTLLRAQHRVTGLGPEQATTGIRSIAIDDGDGAPVRANEAALEAIEAADAIVFGPGSFYTSILPHLLIRGTAEAIAGNGRAPRIFVGNILECRETQGLGLGDMLRRFDEVWRATTRSDRPLTHLIANRVLVPFRRTVGPFPYLQEGGAEAAARALGCTVLVGEFEDAWQRGQHDGEAVADAILGVLG